MTRSFSKPLIDVASKTQALILENEELLTRQKSIAVQLLDGEIRDDCILCGESLDGAHDMLHRGVPYFLCSQCHHIQTKNAPPDGYPHSMENGQGFDALYREIEPDEFSNRCDRIYEPKLKWLLAELKKVGRDSDAMTLLDLGAGAGYFVSVARQNGFPEAIGVEENANLVDIGTRFLGDGALRQFNDELVAAVTGFDAELYTAWFVLEHIENPGAFWRAFSKKPTGTMIGFSIPIYGFGAMLENTTETFFARNLDSVFHTQHYTPKSLEHALSLSNCDVLAEWVFGQDAADLYRTLVAGMEGRVDDLLGNDLRERLEGALDGIQEVLDQNNLADSRHVLAVRR